MPCTLKSPDGKSCKHRGQCVDDRRDPETNECPFKIPDLDPLGSEALFLFMKCQTQWNVAGMGGRIGIPDAAFDRRAALYGITITEIHQDKLDDCVSVVLANDVEKFKADTQ